MAAELQAPDLSTTLKLDPYAPREARHRISQVDNPSPDLRDAVVLLASELVTRAVECAADETAELRVWMPADIVRIELHASIETIESAVDPQPPYSAAMLEQITDRWGVSASGDGRCLWFEIDRRRASVTTTPAAHGGRITQGAEPPGRGRERSAPAAALAR
ncbi:MAG TPA: hypothetical protein VH025_09690 [Solirubrobacteraceae bacterium]|jgi:hypothetical protein|nr:hypothetical protein [Solirubrobacteraceae bacterium]